MCINLYYKINFITYCKWFPFSFIIHISSSCCETKCCLYEVKSHGHLESDEFSLGAFLLNVSLMNTLAGLQWSVFGMLMRHERDTMLSLSYNYTKMEQDQSWSNGWAAWTTVGGKIPLWATDLTEVVIRCSWMTSNCASDNWWYVFLDWTTCIW
jgi:hypothetical protein